MPEEASSGKTIRWSWSTLDCPYLPVMVTMGCFVSMPIHSTRRTEFKQIGLPGHHSRKHAWHFLLPKSRICRRPGPDNVWGSRLRSVLIVMEKILQGSCNSGPAAVESRKNMVYSTCHAASCQAFQYQSVHLGRSMAIDRARSLTSGRVARADPLPCHTG